MIRGFSASDTDGSIAPAIAIVGASALFPEAKTVGEFWENIVTGKNCIREIVDKEIEEIDGWWRLDEYYDPNPLAVDKTYGKTGGFIPPIEFNSLEFGIPPVNLESISTTQLFALVLAKQALIDAGYSRNGNSGVNREKTGVILGVGGSGNIAFSLSARINAPQWLKIIRNLGFPEDVAQTLVEKLKNLHTNWRESSFPGLLGNVVAGRITSHFDLGGTNCTVDAACASSLAALKMAIAELADGSCDAVLTGGVNIDNSIMAYMCFSKTPALSPTGLSRPFDAASDGIVLGDGVGMLVLKRLADAEADGNKIYAVIKGIGTSSDGRAKSIYAPRFEGQIQALKRAYDRSGVAPPDIQLVEAHGTGTIAGDLCEIKTISTVYRESNVALDTVALGSIKSQIGHTRVAAGAASLIKTSLALYHKILPPTINVDQPHPQLDLDNSCFYLNNAARPWIQPASGAKRRAAVSSFGFGGTNYHVIVEEYESEQEKPYRIHRLPDLVLVWAENAELLRAKCQGLVEEWRSPQGARLYREYLAQSPRIERNAARVGFVSTSVEQSIEYLEIAMQQLSNSSASKWQHPQGIYYRRAALGEDSKIVALFPGQGSQYLNMGLDLANNYPELRLVLGQIDRIFYQQNRPAVSQVIYPPPSFNSEKVQQHKQDLLRTENAQPAIGAISAGMYKLLHKAGFKPDFAIGHSFGELTALWAAGVLDDEGFYRLSIARGLAMQLPPGEVEVGAMLAVNASAEELQRFSDCPKGAALRDRFTDIQVTNYNSNSQTVLGGSKPLIAAVRELLEQEGFKAKVLDVANAFHTDFVRHAAAPLAEKIAETEFKAPQIPVYSNVTGEAYPQEVGEIKELLSQHLLSPVAFKQSVESVYQQGGRIFVEIGPKNVLSSFVGNILQDREHLAIALNPSSKGSESEFRRAVVQLLVAGVELDCIDPYSLPELVEEADGKRNLSVSLDGGLYLNPDTKETVRKLLLESDPSVWENIIATYAQPPATSLDSSSNSVKADDMTQPTSSIQPQISPIPDAMQSENTMSKADDSQDRLSAQIESQNAISSIHQQFQQNQAKHLELIAKIIDQQTVLLDKYSNLESLPILLQNLEQIVRLLQTNLNYINSTHNTYLGSQLSLLEGRSLPAVTAPVVSPPAPQPIPVTAKVEPAPSYGLQSVVISSDTVPAAKLTVKSPQGVAKMPPAPPQTVKTPNAVPIPAQKAVNSVELKATPKPLSNNGKESVKPAVTSQPPVAIAPPQHKPVVAIATAPSNTELAPVTQRLLAIVSEKTGYPVEMLDLNLDLEADMGIDSIKQVEILGAMHEEYPQIRLDAESVGENLGELRTLAQISAYIEQIVAPNPPQLAIAQATLQPEAIVQIDSRLQSQIAADIPVEQGYLVEETEIIAVESNPAPSKTTQRLLAIVSEKTGYPVEMLDLNLDLEADMGIDSIKQVEILGAMHEEYPQIRLDAENVGENLAELKTLAQISGYIEQLLAPTPAIEDTSGISRQLVKKNG